jgi:cytochrome c oxidase cbb3-type subunit 3
MRAPRLVTTLAALLVATGPLQGQAPEEDPGENLFNTVCSRCHGVGGTGGEGPALQGRRFRTVEDLDGVATVISEGLGAMPGNWWLGEDQVREIADYVWRLARVPETPVPGDPLAGREVFEERDRCLRCHIVDGRGTGLGPDLSDIGARRGPESLLRAVVAPGEELPRGEITPHSSFLVVEVTTADGARLRGLRIREDAFRIALRDRDGRYHSLAKSDLESVDRFPSSSLMPDYARSLSETQIEDLVAYLSSLRGS